MAKNQGPRKLDPKWLSKHHLDEPERAELLEVEEELDRKYEIEETESQKERLKAFLKTPKHKFKALLDSLGTSEARRAELCAPIHDWVAENADCFPEKIRGRMNRIAWVAGAYTVDVTRGAADIPETKITTTADWRVLEAYFDLLFLKCPDAIHVDMRSKDGSVNFPTPEGAKWEDVRINFRDGHTILIRVKGVSGTYNYTQMGMVRKNTASQTLQWELLRDFADGHGTLDWNSPRASRQNQKRKERLSKDLQRFFRIQGDPFTLTKDGRGWESRFVIFPD